MAVGGAGLPGHGRHGQGPFPGGGQVGPFELGQDFRDQGAGLGRKKPRRRVARPGRAEQEPRRPVLAQAGQIGIEIDQGQQGDLAAAEHQGQAVMGGRLVQGRKSAPAQQVEKRPRAHGIEQTHGRHVARSDQGLLGRDPAKVQAVVVFGSVAGEPGGDVEQQALGINPPLVHGQGVEKGFEGRARGAADGGAVDLAEAGITEKVRAADHGQDLASGRVEDHGRNRPDAEASQPARPAAQNVRHGLLGRRVQGGDHPGGLPGLGPGQFAKMGRDKRRPAQGPGQGRGHGLPGRRLCDETPPGQFGEQPIPNRLGRPGMAHRIEAHRRAR